MARGLPAVALGARGQDRPPLRRGPRTGRRRRRAASRRARRWRGSSPATSAGSASSGRSAPTRACTSIPARGGAGLAGRERRPTPKRSSRRLVSQRAPDLHPDRRQRSRGLHDPRRERSPRRRGDERRSRAPAARRDRQHVAGGARLPPPRRRPRSPARLARRARRGRRPRADEDGADRPGADRQRRRRHAAIGRVRRRLPPALGRARAGAPRLPRRRRARRALARQATASSILETGFGLGNNFLATWAAWRADPDALPPAPFHLDRAVAADAADARLARARRGARARSPPSSARRWPPLTCNLHRIAFDGGGGRAAARLRRRRRLAAAARRRRRRLLPRRLRAGAQPGDVGRAPVQGDGAAGRARRDGRDLERRARRSRRPAQRRLRGRDGARQRRQARHHARPLRAALRAAPSPRARDVDRRASSRGPVARTRAIATTHGRRARRSSSSAPASPAARWPARSPSAACDRSSSSAAPPSPSKARATPPGSSTASSIAGDGRHARFHRAAALAAGAARARGDRRARRARQRRRPAPHRDAAATWPRCRRSSTRRGCRADYVEALDRDGREPARRHRAARRPPGTTRAAAGSIRADWRAPGSADAGAQRAAAPRLRRRVAAPRRRRLAASATPTARRSRQRPRVVLCNGDGGASRGRRRPGRSAPARPDQRRSPRPRSRRSRRRALPIAGAGYVAPAIDGTRLVRRELGVGRRRPGAPAPGPAAQPRSHGGAARPGRLAGARSASSAGSASAGRATIACRSSARCPPASRRAMAPGLRRRRIGPLRPAALRRAGAGPVRVRRARLARHRVGSVRRGNAGRGDRRRAVAGRGRPARCGRPGALPESALSP